MLVLRSGDGGVSVYGALWNDHSCAAAAVEWDTQEGAISSLFVDPKARRYGIARRLLELILEEAARRGVLALECSYILRGEELTAMDTLFSRFEADIEDLDPICGMDSRLFHDSPLVGAALRSGFQAPEKAVFFSALTQAQRKTMDAEQTVPAFLKLSGRDEYIDPDLSAAWVENGVPVAWTTACQTGADTFALTGVWRGPEAPEGCLRMLIAVQLNRCRYRCGGDFILFHTPVNERSRSIGDWFTGGNYDLYAYHSARVPVSKK